MNTYSKDEVLGLAESLAMKASTEEFDGYTSDAELLSCAASVLRDFARVLGDPVALLYDAVPEKWNGLTDMEDFVKVGTKE